MEGAERSLRVAIVGGGIGGAAAAGYLARIPDLVGVAGSKAPQVSLFERRWQPDMPDGGALHLRGEALEVLADFGLDLATLRPSGAGKDSAGPPTELHLTRDALANLLLHQVRDCLDLKVNCEVVSIREMPSCVEVDYRPLLVQRELQFFRNEDAAVTTEAFDLVIGADGNAPTSKVLKGVVGEADAQAKALPMLVIQALVPCGKAEDSMPDCEEYLRSGPHGIIGKLILQTVVGRTGAEAPAQAPDGLQNWAECTVVVMLQDAMRNFPRREAWAGVMRQKIALSKDDATKARAVSLVDQAEKEFMSGGGAVTCSRLRAWVPFSKDSIPTWHSSGGRCILLGDAAHLMPPMKGWGASCAMGDARELAVAFAEASAASAPLPSECWTEALQRYEASRREVASGCVAESKAEARKVVGRY